MYFCNIEPEKTKYLIWKIETIIKKTIMKRAIVLLLFIFIGIQLIGQQNYRYDTVPNDPLHARIYKLANGLTIYMTDYKDSPTIQTYITVKVGSKNDPSETTGLAHYFEHLMFKGTPHLGTINWEKEEPLLSRIEQLFEVYRAERDNGKRDSLYHLIDSISYEAAKFAIPNEYSKIMKYLGSQGTNAGTSNDYTIYIENIPSNQLENWAIIQADRFESSVIRLFHTELETVYEEKNRSLTSDSRKVNELMMKSLYPNHPYGQQTTLGEAEHLKNPSITKIREFFSKYYVPNNMAICLSGDLDFDQTIAIIDKYFGRLQSKPLEPFKIVPEEPINSPIKLEVTGLEASFLRMAFRIDQPANSEEIFVLNMLSTILSNGKAGLLDLNLNQLQKVANCNAYSYVLCDNSALYLYGKPKNEQTLEEVQELLLQQIALLKRGDFDESLIKSAIDNMKLNEMRKLESNSSRARSFANAFNNNISWEQIANTISIYEKITKEDIVRFANKYLADNYVVIYKLQGTPKEVVKVNKPAITPIPINREEESILFKQIKANNIPSIDAQFADFKNNITYLKHKKADVYYIKNVENETFSLSIYFDYGELHDLRLPIAASFLQYAGTSQYSGQQIKQELYNLASDFHFSCYDDQSVFTISGLNDNFSEALDLVVNLVMDAQADEEILKSRIETILKNREDAKLNQSAVLNAMRSYCEFGSELIDYQLSTEYLQKLTSQELIDLVRSLINLRPKIYYYGPESSKSFLKILNEKYPFPQKTMRESNVLPKQFENRSVEKTQVYFVPYNAKQARVVGYFRGDKFNLDSLSYSTIYNQYFGGGMNAIVFQEMREKRSLAYTAQSRYVTANELDKYNYNYAFIGTQSDKVIDAILTFEDLFNSMPISEQSFELAKKTALNNISTNRTTKREYFSQYRAAQRMGIDFDVNQLLFEQLQKMTLQDVIDFNNNHIKNRQKYYMILGREEEIDLDTLEKTFGKVIRLQIKDIFGY